MNCILIQVLNGVTSGPSPVPGLLPPSHPTPSEVGDGRIGERGRVTLLPLGGSGGGVRAAELPLGSNDAQPGEGEGGLSPFPLVIPPSQPTLPQVGEGLSADGGDAPLEGGYMALLEATEELPQEWTGEMITYESVPLISYTPRPLVIDVCAHVKR